MSKETGGQAFPIPGSQQNYPMEGMTLRDYFAAKAMQGWLSSYGTDAVHPVHSDSAVDVAKNAYALADEMLKAREA